MRQVIALALVPMIAATAGARRSRSDHASVNFRSGPGDKLLVHPDAPGRHRMSTSASVRSRATGVP